MVELGYSGYVDMNKNRLFHQLIIGLSSFFLIVSIIAFLYGLFVPNEGDPYVGSIDVYDINKGWKLSIAGEEGSYDINLPVTRSDLLNKTVYISNTLPDDIENGMNLCLRSSMNDTFIYIDGAIRASYSTNNYYDISYHLPSAYIFCDLSKEDAGREIVIKTFLKSTGALNDVNYGYPGTIYYQIHENGKYVVFIGFIMLAIGIITIITYLIFSKKTITPEYLLYIGELTTTLGLWLLSETRLRQWLFASQVPTGVFAYITIELVGVFACLYFDSVQEKRYHRIYRICEAASLSVLSVNSLLAVTKLCDYYRTLIFSHIVSGVIIIISIATIVSDIRQKQARNYRAIIVGMALFILSGFVEMIHFYTNRQAGLGFYIAIGMIILLLSTIGQIFTNDIRKNRERFRDQERFALRTLEAFAGSIDSRDEYTGGHSYRVAEYATKLARAVADIYHFSEADLLEIHHIGLMHDIGKIALPDSILRCSGKLTEEEFSLVKQHVVIGEQLLISLKHSETLLDGVRSHHERYDGTGYPDGLSGEDIPVIARILAIADSYDAMTSERIFREPLSGAMAKAEIIACSGSQFDPMLADVFCKLIDTKTIFPIKLDGLEKDESGNPLQSALLELLLRRDTLSVSGRTISDPSHIRTTSFIAKIAEKNESKVDIYLAELAGERIVSMSPEDAAKRLNQAKDFLCGAASLHDLILYYSPGVLLLVYIDRKDSDIADILSQAKGFCEPDSLIIKRLSPALMEDISR